MKSIAQLTQRRDNIRERISPLLIFSILLIPAALFVGIAISSFSLTYGIAAAGALIIALILPLRWDEFMVVLIIAVHILIDWYLAFRLVSLLLGLLLLFVCYLGRSTNHPWVKPRFIWLWGLFLILTIYPAIKGGSYDLYDADTYYPSLVLSAFIMFWLGNIIAKDISAVRRVFQLLAFFAALIAIHTLIEATTGRFLFESTRAEAALAQNSFQLVQNLGAQVSRAGSFMGHPNENGDFLAFSFFLPLGLFIVSKRFWARIAYLLEMSLIMLALTFTYSTGAWIALLVGMLAFVVLVGHLRHSLQLSFLIAIFTVIVFTVFSSQLALQISHATATNESSLHQGSAQTAIRVIEAYPLFGVGLGNETYLIHEEPFRVPAQTAPVFEPDNSYLQWGAEAGIAVMLVFLLLLGCVFWFSWRNWRAIDPRYRPLLGGGIASLIVLSIDSLSNNGWTDPSGMASLGWLVAGLVVSPLLGRSLFPVE